MKIVLVAEFYGAYLAEFQSLNSEKTADLSYDEHLALLGRDYFGFFPSLWNHFRRIGYEADLIVPNYYPLQQKWLKERKIALEAGASNRHEIVLRQAREMKPDVFFLSSMFDYYGGFLGAVSQITPNLLTWITCPFPSNLDFSGVKCVLSSNREYPKLFQKLGVKSERLGAAFDSDILGALQERRRGIPVSFVGSLSGRHRTRTEMLEWLIRRGLPLGIWGLVGFGRKERLKRLFGRRLIEKNHRGSAWGLAMYQTLADSKITLNVHIDLSRTLNAGGNMRTYEATGCGALMASDLAPEEETGFVAGRDFLLYSSREELLERLNYYLAHEEEAAEIARNGRKICLERHTYAQRIREFDEIIRRYCG